LYGNSYFTSATINLIKIDLIRPAVRSRQILKEENITDETPQQRIMQDKFLYRAALFREFLLN